jgi:vacuolar-type H+-ATPase subunit I/STV1
VGSTPASPTNYFYWRKFMRKWIGLFLSILLIATLLSIRTATDIFKPVTDKKENMEKLRIVFTQNTEKEGKGEKRDTYSIALLKQIREKVDVWLKSLNERIEREDITRFEVRFYEILRDILEWVKEKIDAKIDSSEEKIPKKEEKRGFFRETRQRVFPLFEIG